MGARRETVRLSVRPEPRPEEREALERALAVTSERATAPSRSAWWREGVSENTGDPWLEPPA